MLWAKFSFSFVMNVHITSKSKDFDGRSIIKALDDIFGTGFSKSSTLDGILMIKYAAVRIASSQR